MSCGSLTMGTKQNPSHLKAIDWTEEIGAQPGDGRPAGTCVLTSEKRPAAHHAVPALAGVQSAQGLSPLKPANHWQDLPFQYVARDRSDMLIANNATAIDHVSLRNAIHAVVNPNATFNIGH